MSSYGVGVVGPPPHGKTHIFPSSGLILIIQKPKITFSDVLNCSRGARGEFDLIWWVLEEITAYWSL